MKHLNNYKIFENREDSIYAICRKYTIFNYTINDDGSINVNHGIYLNGKNLTELPLKFNRTTGWFDCANNELTSLEGSPKYVRGDFYCQNNKITSLEGCPEHIAGHFFCEDNPIYSIVRGFIYRKDKDNLIELFNYYDIVQGMNVIYDRLKFFYDGINVKVTDNSMLKDIERNGYKIIR